MLSDETILSVNAPRANLCGPYIVVYKDCKESWAIAAIKWGDEDRKTPTLGIRWFPPASEDQSRGGFPAIAGIPVWYIIPDPLHKTILAGLPLKVPIYHAVIKFLAGEISGDELRESTQD